MAFVQQMETLNNGMSVMNNNFNNNPNDKDIPLSMILDNAIQRTYHQLVVMTDMFPNFERFPSTSDKDRKIEIVKFACKTRQLFMRIYALVKFRRTAHINVSNILSFLDQQSFIFVDTADYLYHLARVKLVNARLPNYAIPTAVDVLTLGTYSKLPTCIKERILPPEPIKDKEKEDTLKTLNRIIQCRLALSDLPQQFYNFIIDRGHVKFHIKNEFEVMLTLPSDDYKLPWRLLFIKILVKNPQDPNRTLVHPKQVQYMHDVLQKRLYESDKPLIDLFKSLHFFCQSLKLEILSQQLELLNGMTYGKCYRLCEYANLKQITVKYWLEYSRNEYDFRFTIFTGENTDYLQTTHYPPLNWNDHKEIDVPLKTDDLQIQKIIHQIIKIRSKARLRDLKTKFDTISYCQTYLDEDKPALKITFLNSSFDNESLWISIDFYSGLFSVYSFYAQLTNLTIFNSIETYLNNDMSKLDGAMFKFRIYLILKRCEITLRRLPFRCTYELPIVTYLNNEMSVQFNKIEKNRLFIELKDKIYLMVTCKTREDVNKDEISLEKNQDLFDNDENYIQFNYYLLKTQKCKFDGDLDPSMQYLKLISIAQLKRESVVNFSNFDINNRINENNNDAFLRPLYEINKNGLIMDLLKMISNVEERLGLFNCVSLLNKQNILTQSIQIDKILNKPHLNILTTAKLLDSTSQQHIQNSPKIKLSHELSKNVLSCTIRKINYTKQIAVMPVQKPFQKRYNYTVEFKFNEQFQIEHYNKKNQKQIFDIYIAYLNVKNIDQISDHLKWEWLNMCNMYKLYRQLKNLDNTQIKITFFNFKYLIINYGCNLAYRLVIRCSPDLKTYDICLLTKFLQTTNTSTNTPLFNYDYLYLNEIKSYLNSNLNDNINLINLMHILNEKCVPTYALAKLSNLPKLFYYPFMQVTPLSGFMLVIQTLTHYRLYYFSRYAIEIHVLNNGLVSIKDASFGLTDLNASFGDLQPIQLLSSFLHLYWDDNVEELLKRRSSVVEDDNPTSPMQTNYNNSISNQQWQTSSQTQSQSQSQTQQQQPNSNHIFLPPTSPAIRPQMPIPSPIHNYSVNSPNNINTQNQQIQPYAQPASASIATPSPGSFQNYGSPAIISHSSPGAPLINNHTAAQSPGAFLHSPAPNYSIQSPANAYEFQMQSPIPAMPIKSPFTGYMGPSPNPVNVNIQTLNNQTNNTSTNTKDSLEDVSKMGQRGTTNQQYDTYHYKKCYSASVPIFLSHNGFLKILTPNPDTGYTPLETFLASNHLKKTILKHMQNDSNSYRILSTEQNIQTFATKFLRLHIINDVQPNINTAFTFRIELPIENQQLQIQHEKLQEYFNLRILIPPYRATTFHAFLNLLSIQDQKFMREIIQLLDWEINVAFGYRIKLCWTVPYTYHFKIPNTPLAMSFQPCGPAFLRKDKYYYFMFYLIVPHSPRIPSSQSSLLYACAFDPLTNLIQCEQLKPMHDNNFILQMDTRVIGLINQAQEMCKSRNDLNVLPSIFSHLTNSLNQPPPTPMMQPTMM